MEIKLEEAGLEACGKSRSFLQSDFWARFKAEFGWKPQAFLLSTPGQEESRPLLVMSRRLQAGLGFAYIPHGPEGEVDLGSEQPQRGTDLLAGLARALKSRLPASTLFIRYDPPWSLTEAPKPDSPVSEAESDADPAFPVRPEPLRPSLGSPLQRSAADIQPPDTVVLDLSQGEADLLLGMKPKWRYNIRLAEKKGVEVSSIQAAEGKARWGQSLEVFYRLYEETSARDKIALHPASYYRKLFELAEDSGGDSLPPELRVWTARHEGEALASIITIFWRGEATYLYGASSNEKRNLMPTYALQWEAIKAAKAAACQSYDFYGVPPTEDPDHPMAGLYRFKTGFGGAILHRAGSWDLALRPALYAGFRRAEALRSWYYKDFRKRGLSRS